MYNFLFCRFDLIFLMLDPQDETYDRRLANHLVSLYYKTARDAQIEELVSVCCGYKLVQMVSFECSGGCVVTWGPGRPFLGVLMVGSAASLVCGCSWCPDWGSLYSGPGLSSCLVASYFSN